MATVTYLLGAGASANCLPTYINFERKFQLFTQFLSKHNTLMYQLDKHKQNLASNIFEICTKIEEEFQFHNTPDTIAKKYFHTDPNDSRLTELKEILILFFLYQQILKQLPEERDANDRRYRHSLDKRYDAFIAALLRPMRGKLQLYDQFKILSWNYDLQFEIAFSRYQGMNIPSCQNLIQSHPGILEPNKKLDLKKFCVLHLNGIAYARGDAPTSYNDFLGGFFDKDIHVLNYLTEVYKAMHTTGDPGETGGSKLLSFAWEKQNEDSSIIDNELLKNAAAIAKYTEVLIIIGYSFPIFNNAIDKLIFKDMPNIKKIYIQSPSGSDIKSIIKSDIIENNAIDDRDIIDLKYWNQFHVPAEWNKDYSVTDYTGISFK